MPWMKVDLINNNNWVGMPGIIYNHNNAVIDTVAKFATYVDAIGLSAIQQFGWYDINTKAIITYGRIPVPPYWGGVNFNIYPGQGIQIAANANCTLPIKFGQGYKRHLIYTGYYCEWLGQEEFDLLED